MPNRPVKPGKYGTQTPNVARISLVNGHTQQSLQGYQSEAHRQAWRAAPESVRLERMYGPGSGGGASAAAGQPSPAPSPAPFSGFGSGPAAMRAGTSLGGGEIISAGPVGQNTIAPDVYGGMYSGQRTDLADGLLPATIPAYAVNVNSIEAPGRICARRGFIMASDSRATINSAAYSSYYGNDIIGLDPMDMSEASTAGGFLLVGLASAQTFGGAATNVGWVTRTGPKWSRRTNLAGMRTLSITVTSPGAGQLRVVAVESGGVNTNATVALTVRYGTTGYPFAWDGTDRWGSTVMVNTSDSSSYDALAWTGASVQIDKTGLTAGTYYVSAWAHSREGMSERAVMKVVVA